MDAALHRRNPMAGGVSLFQSMREQGKGTSRQIDAPILDLASPTFCPPQSNRNNHKRIIPEVAISTGVNLI